MTPVEIVALMKCYFLCYPTDESVNEPGGIKTALNDKLIKKVERFDSAGVSYHYEVTPRGQAVIDRILSIPLPQAKTTWVFSDEGHERTSDLSKRYEGNLPKVG